MERIVSHCLSRMNDVQYRSSLASDLKMLTNSPKIFDLILTNISTL